jgi:predicted nucleic acid-binding protein
LPTNADLLLDSSAAVALLSPANYLYPAVRDRVAAHQLGLAGHAAYETYSVLTRLPTPARLSSTAARELLATRFPASRFLEAVAGSALLDRLATAGIVGGAVYDALVAEAARVHELVLISCDRRAVPTYQAMGTVYELVG